jgi:hypothetical protein
MDRGDPYRATQVKVMEPRTHGCHFPRQNAGTPFYAERTDFRTSDALVVPAKHAAGQLQAKMSRPRSSRPNDPLRIRQGRLVSRSIGSSFWPSDSGVPEVVQNRLILRRVILQLVNKPVRDDDAANLEIEDFGHVVARVR